MGERAGELRPCPFWGGVPYDGQLVSSAGAGAQTTPGTTYASPRDQHHVFPFLVKEPPLHTVWRLDTIWITNICNESVYVSVSLSHLSLTRALSGAMQIYGTALSPTTHFAFGREFKPGSSEALDCGGLLVRGRTALDQSDGEGLWAAVSPGLNPNAAGVGNDGSPPGATVSFHGVVLT